MEDDFNQWLHGSESLSTVHDNGTDSETLQSPENIVLDCLIEEDVNDDAHNDKLFDKYPNSDEVFCNLRNLRIKNIGRVIVATLNINSMRNKFEQLNI